MRILAPRKRDSVTGEEVVLSVTNALVTSSRRSIVSTTTGNNNNNNNSTTCNDEESTLVARTTGSPPQVDFLQEKLLNTFGSTAHEQVLSSFHASSVKRDGKVKQVKSGGKPIKKAGKSGCATDWRNRIGESVTYFLYALNAHCCSNQEGIQDSIPQHETDSGNEKYFAAKRVIEDCVEVTDSKNSDDSECTNLCASSNTATAAITSEGSIKIDSPRRLNNNLSNSTGNIIITLSPPVTEDIHVEKTTKPASDKNLVAVVGTANYKIMRTGIYHEKQVKSLCALHALHNLLQDGRAFRQEDLDKICSELDPNSWVNPHKSVFGLGNYDINVIMTALQQKKLETVWFDKRKDPSEELNFENIYGFILNIPSDCRLGWLALPIKRKHWVAIRNLPSVTEKAAGRSNYWNLDSKFDKPESIGATDNLIEYLRSELKSPEKELFLVVTEDIEKLEKWRRNPPPPPPSSISVGGATVTAAASGTSPHLLPVPTTSGESGPDAAAGSGNNRRTSNDSGVVDLLPDLRDINVVDLNKEDLMRRQSSGVWSDLT